MIGQALKRQREARELTQIAVAKHLGITQQSVGKWENGLTSPSIEHLVHLLDLLQLPWDDLAKIVRTVSAPAGVLEELEAGAASRAGQGSSERQRRSGQGAK